MSRKILIFADGTGNEGGLLPDESRTNVYKLYRATRTGPDSRIDPKDQLAFYVPGIGTPSSGHIGKWQGTKEVFQQAVGQGLKNRIRACYVAILGTWQPGDTIYLFGFSRGAYTARCLAHVLEVFGIPSPNRISLDPRQLEGIAKEAVNSIYRLGFLVRDSPARRDAVARFVQKYDPHYGLEVGASAYCMGMWDTVAAYGFGRFLPAWYDTHLPDQFGYVRHALSIDENRKDFSRVNWAGANVRRKTVDEPDPLEQVWFAGNHSDIGGSYPENESRLSDITLQWMLDFVTKHLPEGKRVQHNEEMLHVFPSSDGIMHDECASSRLIWRQAQRDVPAKAILHPSVIERLKLPTAREYGGYAPYRPEQLRHHSIAGSFFTDTPDPKAATVAPARS